MWKFAEGHPVLFTIIAVVAINGVCNIVSNF